MDERDGLTEGFAPEDWQGMYEEVFAACRQQVQQIDALTGELAAAQEELERRRARGEGVFRCAGCGVWWDSGWPNNEDACPECGTPFPRDAEPTHLLIPIAAIAAR